MQKPNQPFDNLKPPELKEERVCPQCGLAVAAAATHCPRDNQPLSQSPELDPEFQERYEILELIGTGGMSAVYKGRHRILNKLVAIKMLHPHLTGNDRNAMRFHREGAATSKLDHPCIVKVQDFGFTATGQPFMVMDFLPGQSLAQMIEDNGYLPLPLTLQIARQVGAALQHAHEQGVLHRDLKPSNIIVKQEGDSVSVKLVDFGIAKILEPEGEGAKQLTQTGEVFGSPYYMSPEQCKGNRLDQRSDLYSLGCVLFECLTGRPPHHATTAFETMLQHINEKAPSLHEARPDLEFPKWIEQFVSKLLETDPVNRYGSAESAMQKMEALRQQPDGAMAQRVASFSNKKLVIAAGAIAILIIGWLTTFSLVHQEQSKKTAAVIDTTSSTTSADTTAPESSPQPDELPDFIKTRLKSPNVDLSKLTLPHEWMIAIGTYKNIEELDLNSSSIRDGGVEQLKDMPKLRKLTLNRTHITSKCMSILPTLPALEEFSADRTALDNDAALQLAKLPKLKVISLAGTDISDDALKNLGNLQSLKVLHVEDNAHIGDAGVRCLHNPDLIDLRLQRTAVTNKSVDSLAVSCPNLQQLWLAGDDVDANIGRSLSKFKDLRLLAIRKTRVTSELLPSLKQVPLQKVDFESTAIGDKSISALVGIPTLADINLGRTQLSDDGLAQLASMKNLLVLAVYHTKVSNSGMQALGKMKQLEVLDIGNTKVDSVGLGYLDQLKQLKALKLYGCKIDPAAIATFGKHHPQCKLFMFERQKLPAE